jgi:thioredoxin 1
MANTELEKVSTEIRLDLSELNMLEIGDRTFEQEVLKSDLPVVVDFWAEWCAPCKIVAPILADIAREYAGKIKIVKLNVEDNSEIPRQYGICSIPTLMIFQNGQKIDALVGALPKVTLVKAIEKYC